MFSILINRRLNQEQKHQNLVTSKCVLKFHQ